MGLIITSAIVNQARGKVGEQVFGANKYGDYVRTKGIQPNPATTWQSNRRTALNQVKARWPGLTESQREAWNEAALLDRYKQKNRIGEEIHLSGQGLFYKLNLQVWPYNTSMDDPPAERTIPEANIPYLTGVTVSASPSVVLTFSATSLYADTLCAIWTTGTISQGIMKPKQSLFKRLYDGITGSYGSSLEIWPQVQQRHGTILANRKIFVKILFTDLTNGRTIQTGFDSALS